MNNYFNKPYKKREPFFSHKFLLYLSFIWVTIYPSVGALVSNFNLGYGRLFDSASENFNFEVVFILVQALIFAFAFEFMLWVYKYFLSFKVYSFLVPVQRFKADCRLYYSMRNVIFGIIVNLSFLYPFIYNFSEFFDVLITIIMMIVFAYNIQKKYSEPLVSHFVFKNFIYPVIAYEIIMSIYYFWRVI